MTRLARQEDHECEAQQVEATDAIDNVQAKIQDAVDAPAEQEAQHVEASATIDNVQAKLQDKVDAPAEQEAQECEAQQVEATDALDNVQAKIQERPLSTSDSGKLEQVDDQNSEESGHGVEMD